MNKFLQSATGINKYHPEYCVLHGNIATDGFRIHRDNSIAPIEDDLTHRASPLIPVKPRNRATVSKQDMIDACNRALALRAWHERKAGGYIPTLIVSMNGRLSYTAKSEETGTIAAEIVNGEKVNLGIKFLKRETRIMSRTMVYKHHGDKDVVFGINPRYLLDALNGMEGETVEIDIPAYNAPFYMTDGTREAVIMTKTVN